MRPRLATKQLWVLWVLLLAHGQRFGAAAAPGRRHDPRRTLQQQQPQPQQQEDEADAAAAAAPQPAPAPGKPDYVMGWCVRARARAAGGGAVQQQRERRARARRARSRPARAPHAPPSAAARAPSPCLKTWTIQINGTDATFSGCANPDNDVMPWCGGPGVLGGMRGAALPRWDGSGCRGRSRAWSGRAAGGGGSGRQRQRAAARRSAAAAGRLE
jgi:hypothetical protein